MVAEKSTARAAKVTIPDPVLIVGNREEDVEMLTSYLRPACTDLQAISEISKGAQLFGKMRPRILVLCCDTCDRSTNAYLQMLRTIPSTQTIVHQVILMCDNADARAACELALGGIVDDYAVYKPVAMPEHLHLTMKLAAERWDMTMKLTRAHNEIMKFSPDIANVARLWEKNLRESVAVRQESMQAHDQARHRIDDQLHVLARELGNADTPEELRESIEILAARSAAAIEQDLSGLRDDLSEKMEDHIENMERGLHESLGPLRDKVENASRAKTHVLVVDDDDQVRKLMKNILTSEGYSATAWGDVDALTVRTARLKPDIILMDVNLGAADGVELTRQIKEHPTLKDTPVLMLSGLGFEDVVRRAKAVGVDGFVVKPIQIGVLNNKIKGLLERAKARRQ